MTKDEFEVLNKFIIENLKKNNPFVITTSRLFRVINYDIQFSEGHKKLYYEFIKHCEEICPPYKIKSFFKSDDFDKQFDIEFLQL